MTDRRPLRPFRLAGRPFLWLAVLTLAFAPLAGAQVCTPTADDVVFDQMTLIAQLALPDGIQNMLYVELQEALVGIAEGDVDAAVAALEDFSNKVENQSGRQIDAAEADLLLAAAESAVQLLTEVTCPCPAAIPQFGAFLADLADIDFCSAENEFLSVSLFAVEGPIVETIVVNGHPDFPNNSLCEWRDHISNYPGVIFPITLAEAEACSQLIYDTAAAAGVTCSGPP